MTAGLGQVRPGLMAGLHTFSWDPKILKNLPWPPSVSFRKFWSKGDQKKEPTDAGLVLFLAFLPDWLGGDSPFGHVIQTRHHTQKMNFNGYS